MMAAPAPAIRSPGRGRLAVAWVDGVSAAVGAGAGDPLKLLVSQPRGPAIWAFATTYGGGLLAGDRTDLEITVGPGARAYLGTQASTKIYRSDDGRIAEQHVQASVADDGLLAYLPDPVTPFAGSRLRQSISARLAPRASLVVLDAVTAGRHSRDEHWAGSTFHARLALDDHHGRPLLRDAVELQGTDLGRRLAGVGCLATLIVAGPAVSPLAEALTREIAATPAGTWPGGILASVSPLARFPGVILRLAAPAWPLAEVWLRHRLEPLGQAVGGEPWNRRP